MKRKRTIVWREKRPIAFGLFLISACLSCFAGCERPTSVIVVTGPTFTFSGSGRLSTFTIYAPVGHRIASASAEVDKIAWQIKTSKGSFNGSYVQGMRLTFGNVPEGYKQTVPSQPQGVPPLSPGFVYAFTAETTNAAGSGGFFHLGRSGLTQVDVPDLCLKLIGGRDVRVKCGSYEPYEEPADLEKFVQEHAR